MKGPKYEGFLSIFMDDVYIRAEADSFVPDLGDGDLIDQQHDSSKVAVKTEIGAVKAEIGDSQRFSRRR